MPSQLMQMLVLLLFAVGFNFRVELIAINKQVDN